MSSATGWTPFRFADALVEPVCQASLLGPDDPATPGKTRLLFSGPDSLERADGKAAPGGRRDRRNLSVKLSLDDGRKISATVSIGGAVARRGDTLESLVSRADERLYACKASGRDRVAVAD